MIKRDHSSTSCAIRSPSSSAATTSRSSSIEIDTKRINSCANIVQQIKAWPALTAVCTNVIIHAILIEAHGGIDALSHLQKVSSDAAETISSVLVISDTKYGDRRALERRLHIVSMDASLAVAVDDGLAVRDADLLHDHAVTLLNDIPTVTGSATSQRVGRPAERVNYLTYSRQREIPRRTLNTR